MLKSYLPTVYSKNGLCVSLCNSDNDKNSDRYIISARTIADLDGSDRIQSPHIAEAISCRNLDRGDWTERGL